MKKISLIAVLLLAACARFDMQGVNPNDFYAAHPIKNKVETKYETHTAHFQPGADRLAADDLQALRSGLAGVSPLAAESVQLQMHPSQATNEKRREHLVRLLRSMGYPDRAIMVEPSDTLAADDVQINIAYAAVVSPHCPDWRTSPSHTFSNTRQGNIGCASVTNLGLMVADPRDLEKGEGAASPDGARTAKVIGDYRSGADIDAAASAGADAAAASTSSGVPAQ